MLQAALEDLESKAAKQEQHLLRTQQALEEQQQTNRKLLQENLTLQTSLERQSIESTKLRTDVETKALTIESLEESRKQTQERFDRIQAEGDTLREEIR